jgi:hypothetical protein
MNLEQFLGTLSEELNEAKKEPVKMDKDDVYQAAMRTAKKVFGDEVDEKKIKEMAKKAIEMADTTDDAIEIVQNMIRE